MCGRKSYAERQGGKELIELVLYPTTRTIGARNQKLPGRTQIPQTRCTAKSRRATRHTGPAGFKSRRAIRRQIRLDTQPRHATAKRPSETMTDLERTIADLVERKKRAELDSPEWTLANNALIALRYSVTGAGDIIEDLDPDAWATYRRFASVDSTEQRQVLPFRKRSQQKQDSEELKARELRKLDPRRQDLVGQIVANHAETKWDSEALQRLHDDLDAWGSKTTTRFFCFD
jgi:hypothetical protein